jgi:P-type conjugative transfer protein TrbL
MGTFSLDTIAGQFYTAGVNYSAAIQPYALHLFFALFVLDILATWIQYTAEGQLDPSFFFGRMIKHVLSGGFVYLMIINGFSWMYLVIQSFSQIGAAISGLPALSPQSVLTSGINMSNTLLNSPSASGVISSLELAFVEAFCALTVGAAFLIVAVELLLTLVKAYLTTGLGVILLGFGGNRFTASAAEGYFTNVIRIGTRLLFFYAVLAIGMQMVMQWETALGAACKPVTTTVPMITSYFVPPSSIVTTICSGTISTTDMLEFAALAVVFAVISVAVPGMAADLVGGTVGLALAHAFEAAYTAQTIARIVNPIIASLKKVSEGVASLGRGTNGASGDPVQTAMQNVLERHQREKSIEAGRLAATTKLNPFDGHTPGYNVRRPDGTAAISTPGTRAISGAASTSPIGANGGGPSNGNGKSDT